MSKEPNSSARAAENETGAAPSSSSAGRNPNSTAKGAGDGAPVTRDQLVEDLQRTISDARKYLEQLGVHGKERAREKREEAQDRVEQWRAQGEDVIRQKPLTAVAVALAVGWVIGKLGD